MAPEIKEKFHTLNQFFKTYKSFNINKSYILMSLETFYCVGL